MSKFVGDYEGILTPRVGDPINVIFKIRDTTDPNKVSVEFIQGPTIGVTLDGRILDNRHISCKLPVLSSTKMRHYSGVLIIETSRKSIDGMYVDLSPRAALFKDTDAGAWTEEQIRQIARDEMSTLLDAD